MTEFSTKFQTQVVGKNEEHVDYSDVISPSGDFKRYEGINVLINSLRNFLLTPLKTYPFDPTYGSELYKKIFEPHTTVTQQEVKYEIKDRIKSFDPRLKLEDVYVEHFSTFKGYRVTCTLSYEGDRSTIQLDFNEEQYLLGLES